MREHKPEGLERDPNRIDSSPSVNRLLMESLTWDGAERRRHKRFKVNWNGMLECQFPDFRTTIKVRVLNISEGGCCIHLEKISTGYYHVADLGPQDRLELSLFLREGVLMTPVEVRWYIPVSEGLYGAGLEFISMTKRNRSLLLAALQKLGN